jgi:hypothetical protein
VVSELELYLYISSRGRRKRKTECWRLCDGCLQVGNNQGDSQRTVGEAGNTQGCRVIAAGFPEEQIETMRWLLKAKIHWKERPRDDERS